MGRGVQEKTRDLYPEPISLDRFLELAKIAFGHMIADEYMLYGLQGKDQAEYPERWIQILEETFDIEKI